MALNDIAPELQNPLNGGPLGVPNDVEQARREADDRANLERQINFAIDEINGNPNIPQETKDTLVANLRSLKTGLGLNANLGNVQKEINDARATANYAATSNAISQGLAANYFFETFDPDHLYSAATREYLTPLINNDPEVLRQMAISKGFTEDQNLRGDEEIARRNQWLNARIANTNDPEERQILIMARNANLMSDPSDSDGFMQAVERGDLVSANAILDNSIHEQAERMAGRVLPGSELYNRLRRNPDFQTADGFGVDFDKVVRYRLEHREEGAAALNKRSRGEPLSEEERTAAALEEQFVVMSSARAIEGRNLYASRDLLRDQPELATYLTNQDISQSERVQRLEALLSAQHEQSPNRRKPSAEEIHMSALSLVTLFDSKPSAINDLVALDDNRNSRRAFLEKYGESLSATRINNGLADMGFDAQQIEKLNKIAEASPELGAIMRNSFLSVQTRVMTAEQQRTFFTNVALGGGPSRDSQEAISITQYYNLGDQESGSRLRLSIYRGEIEPTEALAEANRLQQMTLVRMSNNEPMVNHFITASEHTNHNATAGGVEPTDYQARLTRLGMYNADGSLNVERIMEAARTNRDRLGTMSAAQIGAITNTRYNDPEMTDEWRDMRVIARTAARFKAIEAIQTYGREISEGLNRIEERGLQPSPELLAAQQNFRNMTNADGTVAPEIQRAAIESLLSQQQYFRITTDLREIVADNMIELSQHSPHTLLGHEFTTNQRITLTHEEVQPTNLTPAEVQALRNEGKNANRLFGTQIESNIRQALQGKDMAEIVRVFGSYMTGVDGTQFNDGNLNNISVYELQNALMGTTQATKGSDRDRVFAETDTDGNGNLSVEELVARLRSNGQLATSVAGGQGTTVAAATSAAPAGVPQVPPTAPTPVPTR